MGPEQTNDGWEDHNKILKELGLPEITHEEYIASMQRVSRDEIEDAIHAQVRNKRN